MVDLPSGNDKNGTFESLQFTVDTFPATTFPHPGYLQGLNGANSTAAGARVGHDLSDLDDLRPLESNHERSRGAVLECDMVLHEVNHFKWGSR